MYEPTPLFPVDPVLARVWTCELALLVLVALWKLDPDCLFKNELVENPFCGLFGLELGNELAGEFWLEYDEDLLGDRSLSKEYGCGDATLGVVASSSPPETGMEGNAPLGGVNLFGNTPCLDHLLGPPVTLSLFDNVEFQLGGRGFFSPPPVPPKDPLIDPPPLIQLPFALPLFWESLPEPTSNEGRTPFVERRLGGWVL